MNSVRVLLEKDMTEVPLGTIVRLEEEASHTSHIYMLVESANSCGILVNLEDGRIWSYESIPLHDGAAPFIAFKDYCWVPFHVVSNINITRRE